MSNNTVSSNEVKLEFIKSVYSGKAGACMCGCKGTYWYARAHRTLAEQDRGYSIRDTEVSDAMVKRIFNIINRAPSFHVERGLDGELIAHAIIKGRIYAAYFVTRAVRCEEQVHA